MNTSPISKEAKRLYRLGFAIHWLHPRSKRPIGNEWTSGPRKEWTALKESFQPNFNVGVRLGDASKLENGYLCVIDVDIKSGEKHHRREALAALKEILGDVKCPEVRSGRGNGSRHLYCVTAQPFKTWNPAASRETVKVHMPSKSVSKREEAELTKEEIKKGFRLSKAWEISLYSNGRQVVLPPSIHPDTGKPYFWKENLVDSSSLPLLEFGNEVEVDKENKTKRERREQETVEDFAIDEALDVRWLPDLDDKTRKLIVSGLWDGKRVDDRSAYLIPAAIGLVSAGLDKSGVLTVLTDPNTYLGECAYDHAQTKSRTRAAKWLWNYTVKRVMTERDPRNAFAGVPIAASELDDEKREAQSSEIEEDTDWKQYLERTEKGHIRSTFNNIKTIMVNSCHTKAVVGRDEFANQDYYLCDTPWRSKRGDAVTDIDIDRFKEFCCENFGVEFGDNQINQTYRVVADVNRFHPVREYIKHLEWDGVPRIETWLKDYAGAEGPDEYLRAVSRKVLVAMVKRVFEPGCKFDHVLILEGDQGVGKSTLLARLAGKWFTDQPLNIGDKDAVLTMQSKWLIELGELSSLNRSEVEQMKAFVTQRTDRIRAPYGKRVEEYPRQSVFIGSTNLDEYLKDETGNRRFWPVRCGGRLDFDGVHNVRDQLFAEAYAYYELKEPLYLDSVSLNLLARTEQDKRGESDEWFGAIADIVGSDVFPRFGFEMRQVSKSMDGMGANRLDKGDQMRIGRILKTLGYRKYQERIGQRRKLWGPVDWVNSGGFLSKTANHLEPLTNHLGGSIKTPLIQDFY